MPELLSQTGPLREDCDLLRSSRQGARRRRRRQRWAIEIWGAGPSAELTCRRIAFSDSGMTETGPTQPARPVRSTTLAVPAEHGLSPPRGRLFGPLNSGQKFIIRDA